MRLTFSLLTFSLCAFTALAHDPGLSSARLSLHGATLDAIVTFAPGDVEALTSGSAPETLANVAAHSLEVRSANVALAPSDTKVHTLENKDVEFDLVYTPVVTTALSIRSPLLSQLPFGHRQYFSFTRDGAVVAEQLMSANGPQVDIPLTVNASQISATPVSHPFTEFLVMGIKHILTGYDHLLFLFAVLIGCKRLSSVVKIITAFTIAHSISLAMATLGWVEIPSRIIEPMIAASIVYVGIENLVSRKAISHRAWLTFGFGLVHGFGFASALREMGVGLNGSAVAVPLLAFNSGVEIGQMLVAAIVLPLLWQVKDKPQFNRQWAPACSMGVVVLGAIWLVQRVWIG